MMKASNNFLLARRLSPLDALLDSHWFSVYVIRASRVSAEEMTCSILKTTVTDAALCCLWVGDCSHSLRLAMRQMPDDYLVLLLPVNPHSRRSRSSCIFALQNCLLHLGDQNADSGRGIGRPWSTACLEDFDCAEEGHAGGIVPLFDTGRTTTTRPQVEELIEGGGSATALAQIIIKDIDFMLPGPRSPDWSPPIVPDTVTSARDSGGGAINGENNGDLFGAS
ncbi:hypothetical protein B0H17DRAFT_1133086 [Mycena rosella]|uniref:Uncharacterized protein n=1 Tax=Mycena rosella TaxID=1033263 RepID=A0AAD7DIM8_MYCRO|nr:hypothetical protein B0H17DRAFT_1133086 [Mycena rosella]